MRRIVSIFIILFSFTFSFCVANSTDTPRDYLYSEEYFDYLIESAQEERNKQLELEQEITMDEIVSVNQEDIITDLYEPFKLHIQTNASINPYGETFIKENAKTIIPVGDKFGFYQDMKQTRNKYNSHDYKILAGAEFTPCKYFSLASGLETNFRGIDQNPSSRKVYLTPSFYLNDKISLSFHNKMNVQSKSTDHDVGINISPFKSKSFDFGVYAGITREQSGLTTESVYFTTNFHLF